MHVGRKCIETVLHSAPQNKLLLERVLLVMVPGIDRALFEASRHLLPNMHALLGEPTTVAAKSPQVLPGTAAPLRLFYLPNCTMHALLRESTAADIKSLQVSHVSKR